jgi:hypothetical protein
MILLMILLIFKNMNVFIDEFRIKERIEWYDKNNLYNKI